GNPRSLLVIAAIDRRTNDYSNFSPDHSAFVYFGGGGAQRGRNPSSPCFSWPASGGVRSSFGFQPIGARGCLAHSRSDKRAVTLCLSRERRPRRGGHAGEDSSDCRGRAGISFRSSGGS